MKNLLRPIDAIAELRLSAGQLPPSTDNHASAAAKGAKSHLQLLG